MSFGCDPSVLRGGGAFRFKNWRRVGIQRFGSGCVGAIGFDPGAMGMDVQASAVILGMRFRGVKYALAMVSVSRMLIQRVARI